MFTRNPYKIYLKLMNNYELETKLKFIYIFVQEILIL